MMLEDSESPGKWKSRKWRLALFAISLITLGFFAREGLESLESVYSQFVAGILGVVGLYYGGNVSNKYVVAKAEKVKNDGPDPE